MQSAVVEFGRNVCGLKSAHSSEFAQTEHSVIDLLPEQMDVQDKGGTMRLGVYPCKLKENTKAHKAYGEEIVYERHRHRYEFNNYYRKAMQENGLIF